MFVSMFCFNDLLQKTFCATRHCLQLYSRCDLPSGHLTTLAKLNTQEVYSDDVTYKDRLDRLGLET